MAFGFDEFRQRAFPSWYNRRPNVSRRDDDKDAGAVFVPRDQPRRAAVGPAESLRFGEVEVLVPSG